MHSSNSRAAVTNYSIGLKTFMALEGLTTLTAIFSLIKLFTPKLVLSSRASVVIFVVLSSCLAFYSIPCFNLASFFVGTVSFSLLLRMRKLKGKD